MKTRSTSNLKKGNYFSDFPAKLSLYLLIQFSQIELNFEKSYKLFYKNSESPEAIHFYSLFKK